MLLVIDHGRKHQPAESSDIITRHHHQFVTKGALAAGVGGARLGRYVCLRFGAMILSGLAGLGITAGQSVIICPRPGEQQGVQRFAHQ